MTSNKLSWFNNWKEYVIEASPVKGERWETKQDAYWRLIEDILANNSVSEEMAKEIVVWLGTHDMLIPEKIGAGIPQAIACFSPVALEPPEVDSQCFQPQRDDPKESIDAEFNFAKQKVAELVQCDPEIVSDATANKCIAYAALLCHKDFSEDEIEGLRWKEILRYIALASERIVAYNEETNSQDRWFALEDESFILEPSED